MTTIPPRPNFLVDDDDPYGAKTYHPFTIDSSIRPLLRWRGVPERRISALLVDLDDTVGLADYEMKSLLPKGSHISSSRMHIDISVPIDGATVWRGDTLSMAAKLPETVIGALPGRMLPEVVQHPALPDRRILSAEVVEGRLIIGVEPDPRRVYHLSEATDEIMLATGARLAARRRWIDGNAASRHEEDWFGFIDDQIEKGQKDIQARARVSALCWGETPLTEPVAAHIVQPVVRAARDLGAFVRWALRGLPPAARGVDAVI